MQAKTLIVRVNAVDTEHFASDLQAVVWPALHVVNLPKWSRRHGARRC